MLLFEILLWNKNAKLNSFILNFNFKVLIFNLHLNIVIFEIFTGHFYLDDNFLILKAFDQKVSNQIIQMYHNNLPLITF